MRLTASVGINVKAPALLDSFTNYPLEIRQYSVTGRSLQVLAKA